jgi:hypothetical protein
VADEHRSKEMAARSTLKTRRGEFFRRTQSPKLAMTMTVKLSHNQRFEWYVGQISGDEST